MVMKYKGKLYNEILGSYEAVIEKVVKSEFKTLNCGHIMDFGEMLNLATEAVHKLIKSEKDIEKYNTSYVGTAIKWTIRNELRRRYKWYSAKDKPDSEKDSETTEIDRAEMREALYKTILSIDEMASAENPVLVKDSKSGPDEKLEFLELCSAIKIAIKKLPQRERELVENRFFKDKKLQDISEEYSLSPSRISRIIQSGLDKIKQELLDRNLV